MSKEKYKKWEPVKDIPSSLLCEGLHDDYEGFRVLLKGSGDKACTFRIVFGTALAYRNIDEGDLQKTLHSIVCTEPCSLFIVENSTWLKWFQEESYGIHDDEEIIHYAIYTENDCIDILSAYPPVVEWLNV